MPPGKPMQRIDLESRADLQGKQIEKSRTISCSQKKDYGYGVVPSL
ncbi:hypothetical protein CCACVL1_23819 [Corchorus capsularis]|uniref:Uncharacterized protein n=1 Tax=Corchorus capsularis TaxID=210143 RepID=A0A1R3GS80_COCAP|nr:hypothetical protein CCACVL1_23819 [Corchorus capsularis]